jgi:hypothetical protein
MRIIRIAFIIALIISITYSCSNPDSGSSKRIVKNDSRIMQQDDGTISLDINKASYYKDQVDPTGNTAEWSFVVSKPGHYNVWLSSATIDTMHLQYAGSVIISLLDERLDVKPVGNKIVTNASEVKYPYFRADSFMGSFYIQEPGEYYIQLISDKAVPQSDNNNKEADTCPTKLMSVILTPLTR